MNTVANCKSVTRAPLPLRSPSEGWAANWMFWIRLLLMELILGFTGNSQVNAFVPGLNFTIRKRLMVALGTRIGYVVTCMFAATTIGFPVPLMMQFGVVPIAIYTPLMTRNVLGPALIAKDYPFKYDSDIFHRFFFSHLTLIAIYPLYKVLYNRVPIDYRSIVVFVLPLWKFAAKNFVVNSTRKLVDFMPEMVAFSVDFYGTLFVSVCMYTSGSFYLSAIFILADVGQSLLEVREVHANAKIVLELLQDRRKSQQLRPYKIHRRPSNAATTELLAMVIAVTRNPNAFDVKSLQSARLWACLPHPLIPDQLKRLHQLDDLKLFVQTDLETTRKMSQRNAGRSQFLRAIPIHPASILPNSNIAPTTDLIGVANIQSLAADEYHSNLRRAEIAKKNSSTRATATFSLQLALRQLPNAVYYPDNDGNWGAASVGNLVVFALLEVGSFAFLNIFLRRKFAFSLLQQLAFVLENQMCAVQVHIFVAVIILLQYELFHLGADFSLDFKWLHKT
ncbi:unnamed protein product [Phytophthora fragariaefolia]|uniref:Unnamed protein product n=1 Tax=Phytophthora fragariaefolia TaxID=1490495 RepID=A0A9W6U1I7_9STRA|nr:unnamed protein product [Phytophthora fragariaefolia]